MYRDEILDLYKNPLNEGKIEDSDIEKTGENPSCGDNTKIYIDIKEDNIEDIRHETDACAICTAATSITTEELKDKTVDEVLELDKDWVLDKLDIEISPMRLKCALLPLKTIQKGLEDKKKE